MKKTLIALLALGSASVAFAGNAASNNANLTYLKQANGFTNDSTTFDLELIVKKLSGSNSRQMIKLGDGYSIFAQENKYLGLRVNSADKDNRVITHTDATDSAPAINVAKVKDSPPEDTPSNKVVGWLSLKADGSATAATNYDDGGVISVKSNGDDTTSEISLDGKVGTTPVRNKAQNSSAITLGDVSFLDDNLALDNITLNGVSMQNTTVITGRELTSIQAVARNCAGDYSFNFMINSETDLVDGAIVAAYFANITVTDAYSTNAYTLKKDGENFYLSVGDGHANSKTEPTSFTVDGGRTLTFGDTALGVGKEYTIVVHGADTNQTVALYDGTQLLQVGNYNSNMNGTVEAGQYFDVYQNTTYQSNVPEPTTGSLSLLALAGLCARRRRK